MHKHHTSIHFKTIVILIALVFIACGGGGGNDNDDDDSAITIGQWSGSAGFGDVEFEVTSNSPEALTEFTVIFVDYTCGIGTYNITLPQLWPNGLEIVDRQIDLVIDFGSPQSPNILTIDGIFEASGDYISGNFELDNGTVCGGTWVAQPN